MQELRMLDHTWRGICIKREQFIYDGGRTDFPLRRYGWRQPHWSGCEK